LLPFIYKASLSTTRDGFVIKKEKKGRTGKLIFSQTREINIDRIRALSVFMRKKGKALKRRRHKGFRVFLLYGIVLVLLNYEENKTKRAKNPIFRSLKALQNKGFSEILSWLRFLRLPKVICPIF